MNQTYSNQQINSLLTKIKTLDLAVRKEEHDIFGTCSQESFLDMADITRRACECMAWDYTTEKEAEKYKRGKCGDFEYIITGCCCADITIYNEKTGKQLDVQAYENEYKLMFCDDMTVAFADRTQTIRAIAYFMQSGRQSPSIKWQPDPEMYGQPLQGYQSQNWAA